MQGDFGFSLRNRTSIAYDLAKRIPNTLKLAIPAYALAYSLAIVLGLIAGSNLNRWPDKIIDGFCSIGIATPTFWFGMLLMYAFGYLWKVFPLMGMHTIGKEGDLQDFLRHLVLPLITLTIGLLPGLIRFVRSSTIGQLTALNPLQTIGRHLEEVILRHKKISKSEARDRTG